MMRCRIAGPDPMVKTIQCWLRLMDWYPAIETEELGQRLDGMVAGRPHRRLLHQVANRSTARLEANKASMWSAVQTSGYFCCNARQIVRSSLL
jgi:hypothetical protein